MQGFPSFPHSPPDCGENSPFSERTASSAGRKCVNLIPDLKGFGSCEKVCFSIYGANRGRCPLDTHNPLKRIDLNFFDRLPEGYRAISTNPHSKFLHFYPSLQILKKPLTNLSSGGIINKLSRETRFKPQVKRRSRSLKIVSMHNPDGKSLWSVAKSLLRSWKLPQKTFSKKLQKTSWQKGNGMI